METKGGPVSHNSGVRKNNTAVGKTPRVQSAVILSNCRGKEPKCPVDASGVRLQSSSTHPLVDVAQLQLDEARADRRDVTLLVGEGDAPRPLGVLQLGVGVDARVAHAAVQPVHDHRQLDWNNDDAPRISTPSRSVHATATRHRLDYRCRNAVLKNDNVIFTFLLPFQSDEILYY